MIVVTGPTARIGRQVVDRLLAGGESVRVIAREPSRLGADVGRRVDIIQGSHRDGRVVDEAFAGADALFWLMPADAQAAGAVAAYVEASRAAVEAVARHRIAHVVGVSALGRGTAVADRAGNVTGSLAMDDLFSGVTNYRALANASFMDNTLRAIPEILGSGTLSSPIRADKVGPLVATRDIAEVAARLLTARSWSGTAEVPLLGPQDLSGQDMASIVGDVLGLAVTYRRVSAASVEEALRGRGVSPGMARAMAEMLMAKDEGLDDGVARTPENTTSTTFRQWCVTELEPAVSSAQG